MHIFSGHTRQGLKCRFCKMNVHVDCQDKAPKCQPKSRLLRRQKSTSEIESRAPEPTLEEESKFATAQNFSRIHFSMILTRLCPIQLNGKISRPVFAVVGVTLFDLLFYLPPKAITLISYKYVFGCFWLLSSILR